MDGNLNVQCFMHVPCEGPGVIAGWAREKGHDLRFTRMYNNEPLPVAGAVDLAVIMGGPMNVYDYHVYPWMEDEIKWVERFIGTGKPVLGICLGAQLIAAALDAEVVPGKEKEIGWHTVEFLPALGDFRIWRSLPASRKAFHWHGDTFTIPVGATRIASSRAFPNQGFIFGRQVIALQFHLEVTPEDVAGMVSHFREDLTPAPHVQTAREILAEKKHYRENQELMFRLLDYLSGLV